MINLRVLIPEDTVNYIQNPSFRYATTGWTAVGSTLTRSLDQARFNIASGKVVTNGTVLREGIYYRVTDLTTVNEPITASVYVRGDGPVRIRLIDNPAGKEWVSDPVFIQQDRWMRIEVTGQSTGRDDMRLYVETAAPVAKAVTFYVDGAQMERKPYSTTYCDGDQPGCRWNVVDSASKASRLSDTREGGRWIPLAGPCRPDQSIYVTVLGGLGMAPISNNIQSFADAPGSFYQNTKVNNRVSTLSFFVKEEDLRGTKSPSLRLLHNFRQQLIDLFKPDRTGGGQAFLFEYSDTEGDRPLYIRMRYEAGLEGEWDVRNGWVNSFPIRLVALDPLWTEDTQDVKQLGVKQSANGNASAGNNNPFWAFYNKAWNNLLTTQRMWIYNIVEAPDGTIYLCGYDLSDSTWKVWKWDGATLTTLGSNPGLGNITTALAVAPDGTVYVGGNFTTWNGVAANYIAKRNPTTGVWSALGTGLNAVVNTICIAQNGQVCVGGNFTTAGGITCMNIARWDGLQWRTVGATSGFNGNVSVIIVGLDSTTMYVGGAFTASNGGSVTYNGVALLNTTTNLFSQVGYGLNGTVTTLAIGKDGTLYAGGSFTAQGSPGTTTLNRVAYWRSGNLWFPLGSGFNNNVTKIAIGPNGELYAAGSFTLSGTKVMNLLGRWFNNSWTHMEINVTGTSSGSPQTVFVSRGGDVYLGFLYGGGGAFVSSYPYYNTLTNKGTTECWPKLYILGQGTLRYVANTKTGQALYLNLPVFSGEEIEIDFAKGTITSKTRGSLLYTILSGSEIRGMKLIPGDNIFAVYMTDEVTPTMQLRWQNQHWSSDGIVDAVGLE